MNDAANDTISLMMQFGTSVVPAAEHLAEILLDAVQTLLKKGANLGNERAGQLVDTLKARIDGIGDHGQVALKNLVKQGRELMVIPVERDDLKSLKSQLKSYQVDFAVQEDALTGDISVHVKAQDLARIEEALKGIIRSTVNEKQADLMAEKEALGEDINSSYDFGDTAHAKEAEAQLAEVEAELTQLSPKAEKAADTVREEPGTPKGHKVEEVECLHGEDRRTFGDASEKPFVALAPNTVMEASVFDAWYQRGKAGERRWMSDHTTSRDEFGQQIAWALDTGTQSFEFEHEVFDLSEARASGAIALTEHDWDKTRPGALAGDERGTKLSNGAYEPTVKSEKVTASGFTLQAYSNGRAAVLDRSGTPVWSACGIAGNIDASKRLADRGLETYQRKESLHLSPQTSKHGDAKAFDAKLDKAEETAAIEAGKTMSQGLSHERERNAR